MKLINILLLTIFLISLTTYSIAKEYPHALPERTTIEDIIELSNQGVSDEIIISQIKATQTIFHLSKDQILYLKENNVSEAVIDFMVNTSLNIPRAELVEPNVRVRYNIYYGDPWYDYWWDDPWHYDDWYWRRRYWHRRRWHY